MEFEICAMTVRPDDFILYLPSNASQTLFPNNTPSHFRIKLPAPIDLGVVGGYELGLLEYCGPAVWQNIKLLPFYLLDFSEGEIDVPRKTVEDAKKSGILVECFIGNTFYPTVQILLDHMKEQLPEKFRNVISFSHDRFTNRVSINIKESYYGIFLPLEIAQILGFEKASYFVNFNPNPEKKDIEILSYYSGITAPFQLIYKAILRQQHIETVPLYSNAFDKDTLEVKLEQKDKQVVFSYRLRDKKELRIAPHPSQLDGGLPFLWLYVDIIESVIVGNTKAPLLRVIPKENHAMHDFMSVKFDQPIYIPINCRIIETVEVSLCKDSGEQVVFESGGKSVLLLHIRPTS